MERLKCVICGKEIEDHGRKYCRSCRKEAYKELTRNWQGQYLIKPAAGYESLGMAIVHRAIRDYGMAEYHEEVIRFFKGARCQTLSGIEGITVLRALEKKYAAETEGATVPEEIISKAGEEAEES